MSYSHIIHAQTKTEAKEKIAQEWDRIVQTQPIHACDRTGAQAVANEFVDALDQDAEQRIIVSIYGSVDYTSNNKVTSVSGTVNVSLAPKA